jgi:protease-4
MNASGQDFLRKALRLFGAGVPMTLASDELFCIRPGASIPAMLAYGPMGTESDEKRKPYRMLENGIAEIAITGVLSKHPSLWRMFGCSSQPTLGELAEACDRAREDASVERAMLYASTPGGTLAGTPEFSDAVRRLAAVKPVHAYADDECCSAGYWPVAQAARITAGRSAAIGNIGVYSVLLDASKAAGALGLKFHVISSGAFKGAGAEPGAGISPEHLAYFQERINDVSTLFVDDFAAGRKMDRKKAEKLADGKAHTAAKALALGLIDGVGSYAEALAALAAVPAGPPDAKEATPPAPEEPEDSEDDPGELPEEEAMSEPKPPAPPANITVEEDAGLFAKFKAFLSGPQAATTAAAPAATAPVAEPAALTAADIDARVTAGIEARFQAAEVERDIQALAGKVPPAVLANAETKAILLEAKAKSPERYKAALGLVSAQDASGLLGGWLATAEQTADAPAGLAVNSKELAALNALGLKNEDIGAIEAKYDLRKVN